MRKPYPVSLGQRFGRGIVINSEVRVPRKSGGTYRAIRLRCDCGNEYTILTLNIHNTNSCGCLRREQVAKRSREFNQKKTVHGRSARSNVLNRYRANAQRRGYAWEIEDDFDRLTSLPCFYCGCAPSKTEPARRGFGDFIYNGIDRVDNTKGYIPGNVVPCCQACNSAKGVMSLTEFETWLDQVASFRTRYS